MLTIERDLFESTKKLVDEVYLGLKRRHTQANLVGSDLPMGDLDELLAYTFLFREIKFETYVNQEGYNNIMLNSNISAIRDRVQEINKPSQRQNF